MQNKVKNPKLAYTARNAFRDGVPSECGEGELNWRVPSPKSDRQARFEEKSLLPV